MEGQNEPLRVQGFTARNAKKGKEYFMVVSIKKTVLMVLLALALLIALFAWTVRIEAMPSMPYHTGIHSIQSSHMLADGPGITCPPPPRMC
jgi:hypothetical protein